MRSVLISCLAAGLLLASQVAAQTPAGVTYIGTACSPINASTQPNIAIHGSLSLGGTFSISLQTRNYDYNHLTAFWDKHPYLLTGFSQVAVPIPTHLFPSQPPGCVLLVDPVHIVAMQPDSDPQVYAYESFVVLTIPNNVNLIGMTFTSQWATVYNALVPNQPPDVREVAWVVFSNAATMTIQP